MAEDHALVQELLAAIPQEQTRAAVRRVLDRWRGTVIWLPRDDSRRHEDAARLEWLSQARIPHSPAAGPRCHED